MATTLTKSVDPQHDACHKPLFRGGFLDRFGMSASFLCALHCAFAPLLVPLLAATGLGFIWSHEFEYAMIGITAVVGGWSLTSSYFKVHRSKLPYLLLGIGMALIALTKLVLAENLEFIGLPAGAILIVVAHWLNYRLVKKEHVVCS